MIMCFFNSGQLRRECNCGLFMTDKNHEVEIKRLRPINLNECSEFDVCLTECAKEVRYVKKINKFPVLFTLVCLY